MTRSILHVDMDAFYVAVEVRRRPELKGQPVVVGGTGGRGVVAAASYEARRFGVHSAMPSAQAQRLCPNAIFLPGDHDLYGEVSKDVHAIFATYTPIIEPIALDEAFLDVSAGRRLFGDGAEIALAIRQRVRDELDLACSVGVATCKMIAKLASEAAKPMVGARGIQPGRGVVVVEPGEEMTFLHPMKVQALWGVGPATLERLRRLGVDTIGDLAAVPATTLVNALGKSAGSHLHRLANAIDDRPVEADRGVKSIGHEETFAHDRHGAAELDPELLRLADSVAARLRAHGVHCRTVNLKVRFADFQTVTRAITLPEPVDLAPELLRAARSLLGALDLSRGVRLIGISGSQLVSAPAAQLSLDLNGADDVAPQWGSATEAIDEIRRRFGVESIGPATLAGRVRRRGSLWGPESEQEPHRDGGAGR
ncbi:MAG: DNA polymerase IV [Acidimicrobiia bacterium]